MQFLLNYVKKRQDVAEWYGALTHSSSDAWSDIKKGFVDAYDET